MRVELRNGDIVEVLSPSEQRAKEDADRAAYEARRGHWLFHFEDGVPTSARWYQRIEPAALGALPGKAEQ